MRVKLDTDPSQVQSFHIGCAADSDEHGIERPRRLFTMNSVDNRRSGSHLIDSSELRIAQHLDAIVHE